MLPGFRFLFAAIALSISILIFGLGAAALLRAAHEEFASNPSWRGTPEPPMLPQQADINRDANRQVLAMLKVEPQRPAEISARASDATPDISPALSAPAEPESVVTAPAETEKVAELTPQEAPVAADAAKDAPAAMAKEVASSTETEAPRDAAPAPAEESKVATIGETKQPPADASPADSAKSEVAKTDTAIETHIDTDAKIEAATIDTTSPEPTTVPAGRSAAPKVAALPDASSDRAAARREASDRAERIANHRARLRAAQQERAKEHRRMAASHRARAARQRAAAQQPQAGLGFGQPSNQTP